MMMISVYSASEIFILYTFVVVMQFLVTLVNDNI